MPDPISTLWEKNMFQSIQLKILLELQIRIHVKLLDF